MWYMWLFNIDVGEKAFKFLEAQLNEEIEFKSLVCQNLGGRAMSGMLPSSR